MIRFFYRFDWILLVSILLLLGLSLTILYPISWAGKSGAEEANHFWKQAVFAGIGLAVFFFFASIDYRNLKNCSKFLFFFGAALLVLVLAFGKVIRGTTGWIGFGGLHLQPVELFKIITIILLAKYFSLHSRSLGDYRYILFSFFPVALSVILILSQPDLGSAAVVVFLWAALLVISGASKKHLLVLFLIGILIGSIGWFFLLKDYQKERITMLFNPSLDPLGAGYNVIQSTVAVGSGGLWGKGLGHGSQSQLNFLPEKHTDFIFAVISEELGLGGALFVFLLLLAVMTRYIRIAKVSRDSFGKLLVGGMASMIFFQSLINIGMNIGVMPVAGIPLPFLSYGGSSLIVMMAGAGIVESVYRISRN
jgi:rod shape determining protein RodA